MSYDTWLEAPYIAAAEDDRLHEIFQESAEYDDRLQEMFQESAECDDRQHEIFQQSAEYNEAFDAWLLDQYDEEY